MVKYMKAKVKHFKKWQYLIKQKLGLAAFQETFITRLCSFFFLTCSAISVSVNATNKQAQLTWESQQGTASEWENPSHSTSSRVCLPPRQLGNCRISAASLERMQAIPSVLFTSFWLPYTADVEKYSQSKNVFPLLSTHLIVSILLKENIFLGMKQEKQ